MTAAAILGPLCAFGCSVTWAVGASLYSKLSSQYSAFAVNFTRACVAMPLFLLAAFVPIEGVPSGVAAFREIQAHHLGWFVLSMVCSYGLGDVFYMWSTRTLGAPGALAVASTYPLWTTGIGVFRGDHLSGLQLLGVLITVAGVVLVILNAPSIRSSSKEDRPAGRPWQGVILALLTSVFWATNTFAISKAGSELALPVTNTLRMGMAIAMSAGFGWLLARDRSLVLPKAEILRSGWIIFLESFLGSALFIYGLSHSSLAVGSTLSSLAPVVSVPVALFLGLERFAPARVLGIVIVVGGLALLVAGG